MKVLSDVGTVSHHNLASQRKRRLESSSPRLFEVSYAEEIVFTISIKNTNIFILEVIAQSKRKA
jgi:hypothetical protein